jgi:hypothetical protein
MNKVFKILATTAIFAAIIPISANAADTASPAPSATTNAAHWAAKGGLGMGYMKQISPDLLKKLNLDKKAFQDKLAQGKTLAQIAQDQGVSREDLKSLLTNDFNQKIEKQKADFAANLDAMVDGKGQVGGGFGHKAFAQENRTTVKLDLTAIAQALGVTNAELKTALTAGKSIADMASEKKIAVQTLIDLEVSALTKSAQQDLADGKITQAEFDKRKAGFTNIAAKFINAKHAVQGKNNMMHKIGIPFKTVPKGEPNTQSGANMSGVTGA